MPSTVGPDMKMLDLFTVASVVAGAVTAVGAPLVHSDLPGIDWGKALSQSEALGDLSDRTTEDSSPSESDSSSTASRHA
ncbi:hypothetical protein AB0F42_18320 [Streptomyces buecherae]|uniref:hypothetical protein n=2 Tax=Streptomyces buecherae TaxID=2763006 RepID=UPI0033D752CF